MDLGEQDGIAEDLKQITPKELDKAIGTIKNDQDITE